MTVHTTLGGGAYGHLGLVLTEVQYAQVHNTQEYIRPQHLGALNIPNTATQYQIAILLEQHQENFRLFREVIAVERALIQKIVAAIDPKCSGALRNSITNKITRMIPEIFTHIFDTYGDITTEDLTTFRTRLEGLRYPANEQLDIIFLLRLRIIKNCVR